MIANRKGSGETAFMRSLAGVIVGPCVITTLFSCTGSYMNFSSYHKISLYLSVKCQVDLFRNNSYENLTSKPNPKKCADCGMIFFLF